MNKEEANKTLKSDNAMVIDAVSKTLDIEKFILILS